MKEVTPRRIRKFEITLAQQEKYNKEKEIKPNATALKRLEKIGIFTRSGTVAQNYQREQ